MPLWHKQLVARLPSEIMSQPLYVGFVVDERVWVWVGFLGVPPIFPWHKFHSTISPHSSHSFCFISFHQPLWWCNSHVQLAPLPFTRNFIASHSLSLELTWPCVGHELRRFYLKIMSMYNNFILHNEVILILVTKQKKMNVNNILRWIKIMILAIFCKNHVT